MVFFRFFLVLISVLTLGTEVSMADNFAYELQPVKIRFDREGAVYLAFLQPCGSEFDGFLLRSPDGIELEVGAIVRRFNARCSSVQGMQELRLPFASALTYASIRSMNPGEEPLLTNVQPIQNLYLTLQGQKSTVQASYLENCSRILGLYAQARADAYAFGIMTQAQKPGSCQKITQVYETRGLDLKSIDRPAMIKVSSMDGEAPYSLKQVPIQLHIEIVSGAQQKNVHIDYLRRCNEAPVGMIRKQTGNKLELSMLVAHYDDMECSPRSSQPSWTPWEETLHLPSNITPKAVAYIDQTQQLRLVKPLSYRWITADTSSKLQVSTYSSCSSDLGLISHSFNQGVAVAILQATTTKPCNYPLKQVTYAYNWDEVMRSAPDVKPLLLRGQ